jgi:hypothetical protein
VADDRRLCLGLCFGLLSASRADADTKSTARADADTKSMAKADADTKSSARGDAGTKTSAEVARAAWTGGSARNRITNKSAAAE